MIAVLDYGMGNLRSAEKALERVGAEVEVTRDADRIRAAAGLVLPGVGAFPKAMDAVRALGFDALMREHVEAGKPVLGICLGMQLLFESSAELGGADGLGLLDGEVVALDAPGLKVPHIGWNEVAWANGSPLHEGLPDPAAFYHVHSFAPRTAGDDEVIGWSSYGSRFPSVVGRGNVFGVQFHPEKSGHDGLALLRNFVRLAA
ncbi:MAG TPA: imidazole glycerol phosphate synthase subunit HisH [Thermoleophilaceae bacterium]|nr:imidazole glycerol phosphate synthase subunit HisH [Thermoleophilaceae bacterium]